MARLLGKRYLRKIVWLNCFVVTGILILYFHNHQNTDVTGFYERPIDTEKTSVSNQLRKLHSPGHKRKETFNVLLSNHNLVNGSNGRGNRSDSLDRFQRMDTGIQVVKNNIGEYYFTSNEDGRDFTRIPPPLQQDFLPNKQRHLANNVRPTVRDANEKIVADETLRSDVGRSPLYSENVKINEHAFDFVISNGGVCRNAGPDLFLVILVFNTHLERENRNAIREHWGGTKNIRGRKVITMFLLGMTKDRRLQEDIEQENDIHADIIQENFIDNYNNLTLKTIMGFKWVSLFCHQVEYVMKVDGRDVFVIPENVVNAILHHATKTGFAEGNRFRKEKPVRDVDSKWYTSYDMFQEATYPPYLEGPAYVMSSDVAKQVYVTSEFVRYLPWEDAYVGLVLKRIGVAPRQGWYYDVPWYSAAKNTVDMCAVVMATTLKFSNYEVSRIGYQSLSERLQEVVEKYKKQCRERGDIYKNYRNVQ
ncbi:uncharacterized protein [Ptychodera flava]|uniref:uncharacterized protein n=1 Tax=Ptychodera flava TaxID=63121 RepID=UPI00396AA697